MQITSPIVIINLLLIRFAKKASFSYMEFREIDWKLSSEAMRSKALRHDSTATSTGYQFMASTLKNSIEWPPSSITMLKPMRSFYLVDFQVTRIGMSSSFRHRWQKNQSGSTIFMPMVLSLRGYQAIAIEAFAVCGINTVHLFSLQSQSQICAGSASKTPTYLPPSAINLKKIK